MEKHNSNTKVTGTTAKLAEILKAKNAKNSMPKGSQANDFKSGNFKTKSNPKNFIRRGGPRGG